MTIANNPSFIRFSSDCFPLVRTSVENSNEPEPDSYIFSEREKDRLNFQSWETIARGTTIGVWYTCWGANFNSKISRIGVGCIEAESLDYN